MVMTYSIPQARSNRSIPSSSRWSPVATAIRSGAIPSSSVKCFFNASTVTSWFFGWAWKSTSGRM